MKILLTAVLFLAGAGAASAADFQLPSTDAIIAKAKALRRAPRSPAKAHPAVWDPRSPNPKAVLVSCQTCTWQSQCGGGPYHCVRGCCEWVPGSRCIGDTDCFPGRCDFSSGQCTGP